MAIYHFNINLIRRSRGQSIVKVASRRSAESLYDHRLDKIHKVRNTPKVVYKGIFLPKKVSKWMKNREKLWNAVEKKEKRKDAQLAREIRVALPQELILEQHILLMRDFAQNHLISLGMVVDLFIHENSHKVNRNATHPIVETDDRVFFTGYFLLSTRSVSQEGFGLKVLEWGKKEQLFFWREAWATVMNCHLEKNGFEVRVDHRSYYEQGINLEPQNKRGPKGTEKRFTHKVKEHNDIAKSNGERIYQNPCIALQALTQQKTIFTKKDLVHFIKGHSTKEQFDRVFAQVYTAPELIHLKPEEGENQHELFFAYRPKTPSRSSQIIRPKTIHPEKKG